MLANGVEYLAALCVVYFFVLHKKRDPKLAAIPAVFVLVQGVANLATETMIAVTLGLMLTVWAVLIDEAYRDYVRRRDKY
jgi:hypothetical protein